MHKIESIHLFAKIYNSLKYITNDNHKKIHILVFHRIDKFFVLLNTLKFPYL